MIYTGSVVTFRPCSPEGGHENQRLLGNEKLYMMTHDQATSWGVHVSEQNRENGVKTLFLLLQSEFKIDFGNSNEIVQYQATKFRDSFHDRAAVTLSYTTEVEEHPVAKEMLSIAQWFNVPTFAIRSLEQAEAAIAEMRRIHG